MAARAAGQLRGACLARHALGERAQVRHGKRHRDAELDVGARRAELVVPGEHGPGRGSAEIGDAIGHVRHVAVEQSADVEFLPGLLDAHRHGGLRGELHHARLDRNLVGHAAVYRSRRARALARLVPHPAHGDGD